MSGKAHHILVLEMKKFVLIALASCIAFDLVVMWMLWD
jgi:hypothetical protein